MNFNARDASMLIGIAAASAGVYLQWGLPQALMAFGGLLIGMTFLSVRYG